MAGQGALGDFFATQLGGTIRMGDTPTVGRLLKGAPEDPSHPGWGGQFVRASDRSGSELERMPNTAERLERFGILELALPLGDGAPQAPEARLLVENQSLTGHGVDGFIRFRFSPKDAKVYQFEIRTNVPALADMAGGITAVVAGAEIPSPRFPNWWTDDPAPELAEGVHAGARTVSRWREEFLKTSPSGSCGVLSPCRTNEPHGRAKLVRCLFLH